MPTNRHLRTALISRVLDLETEALCWETKRRSSDRTLKPLLTIFTGCGTNLDLNNGKAAKSAIAKSGVCIYSENPLSPLGPPESLHIFRVIPGHIEREGFIYHELSDPFDVMPSDFDDDFDDRDIRARVRKTITGDDTYLPPRSSF